MKITTMFNLTLFTVLLGTLTGCDEPGSAIDAESQPAEELQLVAIDGGEGAVDVSISDEDFAQLVDEYDLPLVDPDEVVTPRLSGACSIASSVTGSGATWSSTATRAASCYGYAKFSGDTESDCYIKFSNYAKKSAYKFNDVNTCADAAATWYGNNFAAYYDASANVYLRMDRKWCEQLNCEDGFTIK